MSLSIECKVRPEGINPREMRRGGLLPINLYGHKGAESDVFVVDYKAALALIKASKVNETLVELKTPDWSGTAVIREIQSHPWKRNLLHVSFFHTNAA